MNYCLLWGWLGTWMCLFRYHHHPLPPYKYSKEAGLIYTGYLWDCPPSIPDYPGKDQQTGEREDGKGCLLRPVPLGLLRLWIKRHPGGRW
uniref:Uncharacterized protein n=1 Tax=Sphaerodactylus townsendi TaxID=933632 RepID=A0ACB8FLD4_9SAUR